MISQISKEEAYASFMRGFAGESCLATDACGLAAWALGVKVAASRGSEFATIAYMEKVLRSMGITFPLPKVTIRQVCNWLNQVYFKELLTAQLVKSPLGTEMLLCIEWVHGTNEVRRMHLFNHEPDKDAQQVVNEILDHEMTPPCVDKEFILNQIAKMPTE